MNKLKIKSRKVRMALTSIVIFFSVLMLTKTSDACPYCNKTFYDELLNTRGNTLGGKELLASILNQEGISGGAFYYK